MSFLWDEDKMRKPLWPIQRVLWLGTCILLGLGLFMWVAGIGAQIKATKKATEDVYLSKRARAAVEFEKAVSAYKSGEYIESALAFRKADSIEPSMAALLRAARAYWRAGDKMESARLSLQVAMRYSDSETRGMEISDNELDIVCIPRETLDALSGKMSAALTDLYVALSSQTQPKPTTIKYGEIPENPF
jgi:uncharacterized protein HemY